LSKSQGPGACPEPELEPWLTSVALGPALEIGAGEGELAAWLADYGFEVTALEPRMGRYRRLERLARSHRFRAVRAAIQDYPLAPGRFVLIVANAVLHFLRPAQLGPLAERLVDALAPGGVLFAQVFTTDDPGRAALRGAGVGPVEPETYPLEGGAGSIHYFTPGELAELFSGLEILEYREERRLDPSALGGYRAAALLVARKAPWSGVL